MVAYMNHTGAQVRVTDPDSGAEQVFLPDGGWVRLAVRPRTEGAFHDCVAAVMPPLPDPQPGVEHIVTENVALELRGSRDDVVFPYSRHGTCQPVLMAVPVFFSAEKLAKLG